MPDAPSRILSRSIAVCVAVVLGLGGCVQLEPGLATGEVRIPGPWNPPTSTRNIARTQWVPVTNTPRIAPLGSCTSDWSCTHPACTTAHPGTAEVMAWLLRRYPYLRNGGAYNCRRNTGAREYLSVHSVGRAMDLMITTIGGDADNTRGDVVANFLVENAEHIGIQRVIWDRAYWNGQSGFGSYTGPSPHVDHLHVELSVDGAARRTAFFRAAPPPACSPSAETCNNRDDDCDGRTDEGVTRACGSGVGACTLGVQVCTTGSFGSCSGVAPRAEGCNAVDDDCDGRTDEGLHRACGSDVGECVAGVATCAAGAWGSCAGSVGPRAEACDGRDQDCDGSVDEALVRSCGTDVGECVAGTERCVASTWSECVGAVLPVPERCDRLDNDCDGESDDERICERVEVAFGAPLHGGSNESDVSGEGRADACVLEGGTFTCALPSEHGFSRSLGEGAAFDAQDLFVASAIRTDDLDGDGRADVCGRQGERLVCALSRGDAFGQMLLGPTLAGATEMGLVDVSGDGRLDACVRDPDGLTCHLGTGGDFGGQIVLPSLSDAAGFADVIHHGSLRFGDLNGDGLGDVCARDAAGLSCWRSEGDHFGDRILGPRWSDEGGYDALSRWSTLRLADVDGDGRDDAGIRSLDGFRCVLSDERGFGETFEGPPMDGAAFEDAEVFGTLRMADLDGDGASDLCVRQVDGMHCWLAGTRGFDRLFPAPTLSDAAGWRAPERHRSIRLADVTGDGRADLCANEASGLRCWISNGRAFERIWDAPSIGDGTLRDEATLATLRIAGGRPNTDVPTGGGGCSARSTRGDGPLPALFAILALLIVRRARR